MRIFIFTYDRYTTITTSEYFKSCEHVVLCHTTDQLRRFAEARRIHGELIATGEPKGLAYNRNFALKMMKQDEWAIFFVDDLINITTLENPPSADELGITMENQKEFAPRFKKPCSPGEFLEIANQTAMHAESKGFALCGFSLTGNPVFRNKHHSYWALTDGRCLLVKKTGLEFDTNVNTMDDYAFVARNLKKFGGVVVNNWLLPLCERYTKGGCGTLAERMDQKIRECKYMVETYPEFIAYADKAGMPPLSHVRIRQTRNSSTQEIKTPDIYNNLF